MSIKETLHFSKGSSIPPKEENVLRLYSMRFCPYAERARIILIVKNIPHDIVNVNLIDKPEWLYDLNQQGKVPVLDIGSKILTESLMICEYLNDEYPDPPLYPENCDRNKEKALINKFDEIITLYYVFAKQDWGNNLLQYVDKLTALLKVFENELSQRGSYFAGDKPGMVDYMLWPWAERAKVLDFACKSQFPLPDEIIPNIRLWCARMQSLDVVKETIIDSERLYKAAQLYKSKISYYDNI